MLKNMEIAAKMFMYIFSEMRYVWLQSLALFKDPISRRSLKTTLLLISNYAPRDYFEGSIKRIILSILTNHLELQFTHIDDFSFAASTKIGKFWLPDQDGPCILAQRRRVGGQWRW